MRNNSYIIWYYILDIQFLGKKALVEIEQKFIAKVNSQWWPELFKKADALLGNKIHDYVVLYSEELNEHFMLYNSDMRKGKSKKKCVLTNAFMNVKAPKDYSGNWLLYYIIFEFVV